MKARTRSGTTATISVNGGPEVPLEEAQKRVEELVAAAGSVTLDTLAIDGDGQPAAERLFQRELGRVVENIADARTDPEALRRIEIRLTFKPDAERSCVAVLVEARSKLATFVGRASNVWIKRGRGGKAVAVVEDPRQEKLPLTE